MSFKAGDRQRVISKIWEKGRKLSAWELRIDPWHGHEQPPSPEALADRDRRMMTPDTRSLTGRAMGDPPPGRSALEKKLAEAAKPKRKWWETMDGGGDEP